MIELSATSVLPCACLLGEGPVWHDGTLWWVDIEAKRLFQWRPGSDPASHPMPERIGFAVPAAGGRWVVGLQGGIHEWDPRTRALELLHAPESGLPDNRFNDAKCDPQGRLWAGTMSTRGERGAGSLYRIAGRTACERILSGVTISNGLAWSHDGGTLYYIDTPTREVAAYNFDPATGAITNRRVAFTVAPELGAPDGMTIDAEGMLWVALWGGAAVLRVDPAAGAIIGRIEVPARNVTSCTFGGPGLDTLYITTARAGTKQPDLDALPLCGGIFSCRPGARGLPVTPFA